MIDNLFGKMESARRLMADFVIDWRRTRRTVREMRRLGPEEGARLLSEVGLTPRGFDSSMTQPFASEDLLLRAMDTLDIDLDEFCARNPAWFQDMERTCLRCPIRSACRRTMSRGEFAAQHRSFCPNAEDFAQILAPAQGHG